MATKNLAATITIGGTLSGSLKSALGNTAKMLQGIGKELSQLDRSQRRLGESIQVFGRMGRNVDGLRQRYADTVRQVDALRNAQRRLADAQQRSDRINERAAGMKKAGIGMTVAGGAIIGSMVPGVNEAKHYQNEMARITALGMGDDTSKKAFAFAKEMKTFGTSQLENLELLRDGMSVFADLHHAEMVAPLMAKMKFGNKAVFGSERGEQNSAQFMDMLKVIETRGGLKSEAEFTKQANIIQQVVSATGGRVSATEWRHMLMTGGLAGKGMSSESLFYTMEHLVQEMGGDRAGTGLNSMYKSLYQGVAKKRAIMNLDRFGLIGDKSKVKHDKAGQVASIEPGALLGADLFRENPYEWMNKILLPQLKKKGITSEKEIIDTIGMIVSNSVGGSFLAEMYRQNENIERARKRNMGAQNIDQLYDQGKETATGKELDAQAKLDDAKKQLGENILPMYTKALIAASDALKSLNHFTEENPKLSNALVVGVTAIGVGLVVLGPLVTAAAGIMNLYAASQLRLAAASVSATAGIAGTTGAIVAQNGALMAGIGAIAKRAAVVLAVANAGDYVAGKMGVGGNKIDQEQDDKNWNRATTWEKVQTSIPRGIESVGSFIGLSNMMNQAQSDRIKQETEYLAKRDAANPAMPKMRSEAGAGAAAPVTNNNTFNITQTPGESSEQFARRVAEEMKRQNSVKQRSSLVDGPFP